MRVLVTGGAGYIGTELIIKLMDDESVEAITIYDNLSRKNYNLFLGTPKLNAKKIRFVKGDLLDSRNLKTEVDNADIVYHLAAKVTTPFADHNPHEFDQVNNWGTAELVYLVENSNVKKLIYASSVSVYGASEETININTVPSPKTFYGISKLHGEEHVSRLNDSHVDLYVLRLGNVYGYSKSMRFDTVINKFLFEANYGGKIRIYGDGHQTRPFVSINRLSKFLASLISSNLKPDTYNVVESDHSVNKIADELRVLYPNIEMIFVNQNMKMRSLKVTPDSRILNLLSESVIDLSKDLLKFKGHFSF